MNESDQITQLTARIAKLEDKLHITLVGTTQNVPVMVQRNKTANGKLTDFDRRRAAAAELRERLCALAGAIVAVYGEPANEREIKG